jgi:hypothetical protein
MDDSRVASLIGRVERLERECRRWRIGVFTAVFVGLALLTVGWTSPTGIQKEVESERFVLRDKLGKVRAILGTATQGNPSVSLLDGKGKKRMELGLRPGDETPCLTYFDRKEKVSMELHQRPDTASYMHIYAPNGEPSIILSVFGLSVYPLGGKGRISLDSSPAGDPSIRLIDKRDNTVFQVGAPDPPGP